MPWSPRDRAAVVRLYFHEGSVVGAQRAFRREQGRRTAPERRAILRWVRAFEEQGNVASAPHRRPGPRIPRLNRSVQRAITRNPKMSIRALVRRTGVPRSTIQRFLRQRLGLHPFRLQLVQRLLRGDKAKRIRFCRWALSKWRSPSFRRFLLMTDEAQFHLDGTVNKQNCRVWGTENPHVVVTQEGISPSLTVWCGICSRGIVGPFFFEERRRPVTVTASRYQRLLRDSVLPALNQLPVPLHKVWYQQDGATAHTAHAVLTTLQEAFPGRVISKGGDLPWPPRSPDLTVPDFFLWGYVKGQVYQSPVRSLAQLKRRIREVVRGISTRTLCNAFEAVPLRLRRCLRLRGGYPETILCSQPQ